MINIFENAYFSKLYKTKDGRKAVFLGDNKCWVDGESHEYSYCRNGKFSVLETIECNIDIVSEWHEDINEKELDKLTKKELKHIMPTDYGDGYNQLLEFVYRAGYRKAKEK